MELVLGREGQCGEIVDVVGGVDVVVVVVVVVAAAVLVVLRLRQS